PRRPPHRLFRTRKPVPPAPEVAFSPRTFDSGAPGNPAPNRPPSPARATPPTQSSPSLPRQFSVSFCSSSSAPSVATERLQIQLVNWSQIRGPFQPELDPLLRTVLTLPT